VAKPILWAFLAVQVVVDHIVVLAVLAHLDRAMLAAQEQTMAAVAVVVRVPLARMQVPTMVLLVALV
jgi:hypothetical protein